MKREKILFFELGPLDPLCLLACVKEIDRDKTIYRLVTKHGILNDWWAKNTFGVLKQKHLDIDKLKLIKNLISVREVIRLDSIGNGQGYIKCSCKIGKCNKNCKCKTMNLICNSRCHGRESNPHCLNKQIQ